VSVEAHQSLAMIQDDNQAESAKPVGKNHPTAIDRPNRLSLRYRNKYAAPSHVTDVARLTVLGNEPARHRHSPFSGTTPVFRDRRQWLIAKSFIEILDKSAESRLILSQVLNFPRAVANFGVEAREGDASFTLCGGQSTVFILLGGAQLRQFELPFADFGFKCVELGDLPFKFTNLRGSRFGYISIVDQHPSHPCRIVLVQQ